MDYQEAPWSGHSVFILVLRSIQTCPCRSVSPVSRYIYRRPLQLSTSVPLLSLGHQGALQGQKEEGINAASGLPEPAVEEPPGLLWRSPASVPLSGPRGDWCNTSTVGDADQRRRKVRVIYEVPVSQASVGQPVCSPPLGCVVWDLETVGGHISGSLCHHQLILCPRKPLPMGLCVLPFRAWASGSFFTLSLAVRPICPPQLCRVQLLSSTRGLTGWLILSPW